jgi:membrane associated rhomboid family serine protease
VTTTVLVLCVLAFLAAFLGFGPQLQALGAQNNALVAQGQWYRLLSSAFLHAGLAHIFFNMWALYVFGPPLERRVGSLAFAALYLSAAVAGGAAYFVLGSFQIPAVGASGAIFGLFGAWLAHAFLNRRTPLGRASLNQLLFLLAINAALPLVFPGIAWQAHLGGLGVGFAIGLAWGTVGEGRARSLARALVAATIGTLVIGGLLLL